MFRLKRFLAGCAFLLTFGVQAQSIKLGNVDQAAVINGKTSRGFDIGSYLKWQNTPLEVDVQLVLSKVFADTATSYFFKLNDITISGTGVDCGTEATAITNSTKLKPYKQYALTMGATNITRFNLAIGTKRADFILPGQLLTTSSTGSRQHNTLPNDYGVYVNGIFVKELDLTGNYCSSYGTNWTIELRKNVDPTFQRDDDDNEPDRAPGDGMSITLGPGVDALSHLNAWEWSVSLGHLANGNKAGKLVLRERGISSLSFKPESLFFAAKNDHVRNQVLLVKTNSSAYEIRQIWAPQTFVNIFPGTNQYWVQFYYPTNVGNQTNQYGVYTNFSGSPLVTWWIHNPNGAGTSNKLLIVEQRAGKSLTNELSYDSGTKVWMAKLLNGAQKRIEKRTITFTGSPINTRLENVEVRTDVTGGTVDYSSSEKYENFGYAWLLTEQKDDPTGANLTTRFEYYPISGGVEPENAGKLKQVIYPDGFWEKRDYYPDSWDLSNLNRLKLRYVWKPWLDSPSDPNYSDVANSFVSLHRHDDFGVWQVAHGFAVYDGSTTAQHSHSDVTLRPWPGIRYPNTGYVALEVSEEYGPGDSDKAGNYGYRLTSFEAGPKYWTDLTLFTGPQPLQPGFDQAHSLRDRPVQYYNYDFGTYDSAAKTFTVNTNGLTLMETNDIRYVKTNLLDFRKSTLFTYTVSSIPDHGQLADAPGELISMVDGRSVVLPGASHYLYVNPYQTWKEIMILRRGVPVQREKYVCTGVTNGPVMSGYTNREAAFELVEKFTYDSDLLGHITGITRIDPVTSATRVVYSADYKGTNSIEIDLKFSDTDETGIQRTYAYDSLKRVSAITKKGATVSGFPTQADIVTSFTYDTKDRKLSETRTGSALSLGQAWVFDVAGRLTSSQDEAGLTTTYAYSYPSGSGRIVTKTLPGGATEIQAAYLDRRLKSITGTAKVNEFHNYSFARVEEVGSAWQIENGSIFDKVVYGTDTSARWVEQGMEGPYRHTSKRRPGLTTDSSIAWTSNVWQQVSYTKGHDTPSGEASSGNPIGLQTTYDYFGRPWRKWVEMETATNYLEVASADRLMETTYFFRKIGSYWYDTTTNYIYRTDGSATPTFANAKLIRLNGFNSTTRTEETQIDEAGNTDLITVTIDRANRKVTETLNSAESSSDAIRVTVNGLLQTESTPSVSTPIQHKYDALARETQTVNALGYSVYKAYANNGWFISTTDFAGNTTTNDYYLSPHLNTGRLKSETRADGKRTYYEYTARGELKRKWGDVPYPEERLYNEYGDLIELHTYRSGSWNASTWPGSPPLADTNKWFYEQASGLLTNKTDAAGNYVRYFYTNSQLAVKLWGRGVGITNLYNSLGELIRTTYPSDTPGVTNTYNRAGQLATVSDGLGLDRAITYDSLGRLSTSEDGIVYAYSSLNQLADVTFNGQKHSLKYDTYGRLSIVSNGTFSATYAYLPSSDRLLTTTFKTNATVALVTSRGWDFGERLRGIQNSVGGLNVASFDYLYDNANRRVQGTLEDGSIWRYGYNDRDELISAKRSWSDFGFVPGQAYEYGYDPIGNRTSSKQGGDAFGQNLRSTTYDLNVNNQLITNTFVRTLDVIGAVEMTSSNVTVNSQAAYRRGEYFHEDAVFTTTNTPLYATATVSATYNGSTTTTNGSVLFAGTPETLTYDVDGNLKSDGIWKYTWDAVNRLIGMTNAVTGGGLPNADKKLITFSYDHLGRRRSKTVSTWNGSAFASPITTQFLYDGWRLLAEKDGGGNLIRSYVWGSDLSGDRDFAGGIGGLLMMIEHTPTLAVHFPMYDGNGDVVGYVRSSAILSARYETGPFGEAIRATGPVARTNPIRFSSKYVDEESGVSYYGHRSYSPKFGRWLTRDPIEEDDGPNLYAFVKNDPISGHDPFGLFLGTLLAVAEDIGADAVDALKGASMKWRVQTFAKRLNDIERFKAGMQLAEDMFGGMDDKWLNKLDELREEAQKAAKGQIDKHHSIPRAVHDSLKKIMKNGKINMNEFLIEINQKLHLKGLHGHKGGRYVELWRNAIADNKNDFRDPAFVIGFAIGAMDELGFGDSVFIK